jgi:hypothetical protein
MRAAAIGVDRITVPGHEMQRETAQLSSQTLDETIDPSE